MKRKKTVRQPLPFMNSKLRKACLHKAMLRNRYFKHGRSRQSWEHYRKSRNNVTKLKAVSMNTYFQERCNSDSFRNNSRQYWRTMKLYMTDKCKTSDQDISLFHENKLINDPVKVCKIFNEHFIKAASNIGSEDSIRDDETIDDILCAYNGSEVVQRILLVMFHMMPSSIFPPRPWRRLVLCWTKPILQRPLVMMLYHQSYWKWEQLN